MKKIFTLTTLLLILLVSGCKQGKNSHDENPMTNEVIITGYIKNRDFYPHVE